MSNRLLLATRLLPGAAVQVSSNGLQMDMASALTRSKASCLHPGRGPVCHACNGCCKPGLVGGPRQKSRVACSTRLSRATDRRGYYSSAMRLRPYLANRSLMASTRSAWARPVLLDSEQFELLRGFGDDMRGNKLPPLPAFASHRGAGRGCLLHGCGHAGACVLRGECQWATFTHRCLKHVYAFGC